MYYCRWPGVYWSNDQYILIDLCCQERSDCRQTWHIATCHKYLEKQVTSVPSSWPSISYHTRWYLTDQNYWAYIHVQEQKYMYIYRYMLSYDLPCAIHCLRRYVLGFGLETSKHPYNVHAVKLLICDSKQSNIDFNTYIEHASTSVSGTYNIG